MHSVIYKERSHLPDPWIFDNIGFWSFKIYEEENSQDFEWNRQEVFVFKQTDSDLYDGVNLSAEERRAKLLMDRLKTQKSKIRTSSSNSRKPKPILKKSSTNNLSIISMFLIFLIYFRWKVYWKWNIWWHPHNKIKQYS